MPKISPSEFRQNPNFYFKVKIWFQNHRYKLKKSRSNDDSSSAYTVNPTLPNFIAMRGAETYKTMMHQQAAAASFGYPGSAAGAVGAAVGSVGAVGHGGVGYNTTSASEYAQQYTNYFNNYGSAYTNTSSSTYIPSSSQHPLPAAVPTNLPWY